MNLIWVKTSVPAITGARLVVSDSGDILSPKYAPEIMAPAAAGAGIPRPTAIPIKASPMVPMVPQEVPVARDVIEHINTAATKKIPGDKSFSP